MTTDNLRPSSYTARDYETIVAELSRAVKATRPDAFTDFYESNLGRMLIDLVAWVGDSLSYTLDAVGLELFLATCRRYESALRFSQSVGYRPRGPVASEVTVSSTVIPSAVSVQGAVVPAGSFLTGTNGKRYELLAPIVIPAGSTSTSLDLYEGNTFTEVFEATGIASQELTTSAIDISDSSWDVFVGATSNPDNLWKEVANLALSDANDKVYEVRYNADNGITLRFGDGLTGTLPNDDITVRGRITGGAEGNTLAGTITGSLAVTLIGGGTETITYTNTAGAASGRDRESVEELRVNVPAYLRSADRIITRADYNANVTRVPGVALAFTDVSVAGYAANIVIVNVWASETLTADSTPFVVEAQGNGITSDLDYSRYSVLPENLSNDIQLFLRDRTMVTVHNVIARPNVAACDVYLSSVRYDPRYDPSALHKAVCEAIIDVFQQSSGFKIRVSDLYNAIDSVPGVRGFYLERLLFSRESKGSATGTITVLSNPTDAMNVTIDDGVTSHIFEFDDTAAVTSGSVLVPIGATAADTAAQLASAINGYTSIFAKVDLSLGTPVINLTQTNPGANYNLPISASNPAVTAVVGMTGGDDTLVLRHVDYRRDPTPAVDEWPASLGTPYPVLPPTHPDYATENGQGAGVAPYLPLQDVVVDGALSKRNFYDSTYLYNNEIYYDSGVEIATPVQAINLRSIHFDLVKEY